MNTPDKDYFRIRMLLVGAEFLERLAVGDGVYLLFGNQHAGKGKYYIEVFSPNDPSRHSKAWFLTDINRLLEYALEMENPYRFKRPEGL